MADVEFEDYSLNCKAKLNESTIAWLREAGAELKSQVQQNSRVSTGQTKNSWHYRTDADKGEVTVGSDLENALWEEFGTGEYAVNGDGRKGGWYIKIGDGDNEISQAVVDSYGFKVVEGKDGTKYAYTKGKRPNRALENAFTACKEKLKARLESILRGLDSES